MATRGNTKKPAAQAKSPRKKPAGEYRHGDLQDAALDAAAALVAKRGGAEFSLREIAAAVGVRHAALYRHFASREALMSALATRAFDRMAARFELGLAKAGADARRRMVAIADAYMAMAREEPGAYRVMFTNMPFADPDRQAAAMRTFHLLVQSFAEGQKAGIVRTDVSAITIAAIAWAGRHGLALLMLDQRLQEGGAAGGSKALVDALSLLQREGWGT